ncbi:uncharacterized protein HMPREF1541_11076 [Cyphellophora europaea CBS 101466]|uniref:Phytanoyl-CoA dioxygenase n=1 Tax=Cyphellophora europaea (strain CBS 101466) TaxID=1220924 RepID=W2S5R5_CYPE1|nr:uncharacterized protein HMPREF1541_11076 [Cyphellophora europaea CBS 101466]ETN43945.1 hypothetical protein HMPREF1541_11076 [Cyphellophora europaea CBS 101466]
MISRDSAEGATDGPAAIVLTKEERRRGIYAPETLGKVLSALHQDGLVLLKGIIDVGHIDAINSKMCEEVEHFLADPKQAFNHGIKSNFLQRPPVAEPSLLFEDVYFNTFLLQVANAYLGHKPIFNWITSNNALANTGGVRQPVHKDNAFVHPQFPYYFIANIPLCDFSVANGATEFWLGSHSHTSQADQLKATGKDLDIYPHSKLGEPIPGITEEALKVRRAVRPPVQPECHKGDVMIRDIRTWHAGMANGSDMHRIMIGLGYMSPSYPNFLQRCHLPESQRPFWLGSDKVELRANFWDDEEFKKTKRDSEFLLRPTYLC